MPNRNYSSHLRPVLFLLLGGILLCPRAVHGAYILSNTVNAGEPNFNQELAVNNSGVIAGYFGHGTIVPNKGYKVVSPYVSANFAAANFPGSVQTQVTGINSAGNTVGFWEDVGGASQEVSGFVSINGDTYGFLNSTLYPFPGSTFAQFLGLNNQGLAVGVYQDSSGNTHGLVYNSLTGAGQTVDDPSAIGGAGNGTTINGINDRGEIIGFYFNANDQTIGLIGTLVPEPDTLTILIFGALLIGTGSLFRRRK